MTHPAPKFLPGRREILCGMTTAYAAAAWAPAARAGELDRLEWARPPRPLADFEFVDADDKPGKLSDFKGKGVLVNFWATWCAPCVNEMPSLDRLQAALGKSRLMVLPLSLDGASRAKVEPFYQTTKLKNLGMWFDKGRTVMKALKVTILPTTVLVDAEGREIARLEGELEWDAEDAKALVSTHIAS